MCGGYWSRDQASGLPGQAWKNILQLNFVCKSSRQTQWIWDGNKRLCFYPYKSQMRLYFIRIILYYIYIILFIYIKYIFYYIFYIRCLSLYIKSDCEVNREGWGSSDSVFSDLLSLSLSLSLPIYIYIYIITNSELFSLESYWETRKAFWGFPWLGRRRLEPGVWDTVATEGKENRTERGRGRGFFPPLCLTEKGDWRQTIISVYIGN